MRIVVLLLVMVVSGIGLAALTRRWYLGALVSVVLGAAIFVLGGHAPRPAGQPQAGDKSAQSIEFLASLLASIAQLPDNARLADGRFPTGEIRREMQVLRVFVVEQTTLRVLGETPRQKSLVDAYHADLLSRVASAPSLAYLEDSATRLKIYHALAKTRPEPLAPALGRQFATLIDPKAVDPVYAATGEQICTEVTAAVVPLLQP